MSINHTHRRFWTPAILIVGALGYYLFGLFGSSLLLALFIVIYFTFLGAIDHSEAKPYVPMPPYKINFYYKIMGYYLIYSWMFLIIYSYMLPFLYIRGNDQSRIWVGWTSNIIELVSPAVPAIRSYRLALKQNGYDHIIPLVDHVFSLNWLNCMLWFVVSLVIYRDGLFQVIQGKSDFIKDLAEKSYGKGTSPMIIVLILFSYLAFYIFLFIGSDIEFEGGHIFSNRLHNRALNYAWEAVSMIVYHFFLLGATLYLGRKLYWLGKRRIG